MSGNSGDKRLRGRARGLQSRDTSTPTSGTDRPGSLQSVRQPQQPFRPPPPGPRQAQPMHRQEPSTLAKQMGDLTLITKSTVSASDPDRGTYRSGRFYGSRILVTRPANVVTKLGQTGQRVDLQANFFKMCTRPDWILYHYQVDFDPPVDVTPIRKGLMYVHKEKLGGYLFDGSSLWTTNKLSSGKEKFELLSERRDGEKIRLIIKLVGGVENTDYHYIQVYNVIIKKCLEALQLQLVGRNYYDPMNKIVLRDQNLELWPGYETSIRQREHDLLMSVEIRSKVMRMETALDIIHALPSDDPRAIKNSLIGCTVLTAYNNRTYRIDDVDFNSNPKSTFDTKNGGSISFVDYYHKQYNIRIQDLRQPLLISKTKARERRAGQPDYVKLIPEICRMTGLTDRIRQNYNTMKALAVYTRVGPKERIEKLLQFNRKMMTMDGVSKILREWNMSLDKNLTQLTGRQLPIESIVLGKDVKISSYQNADWTKNMRSTAMIVASTLTNWIIIGNVGSERDVGKFLGILRSVASPMNFNIESPKLLYIQDRKEAYSKTLSEEFHKLNPQMIMTLVPNNRADRYSVIKRMCYVELGVPSQVVLMKNVNSKGIMSIATKIAIQMNAKLGGAPWAVPIPLSGLMVVGFDVCHDTMQKEKSYGATVATIDANLVRYFSCVSQHLTGNELSNNFSANISKAIHKYLGVNNALPKQIIVYRDGVGEGQLPYVFEHEVCQIKDDIEKIYKEANAPLKFAFVVVTKQIATRFFTKFGGNPQAGTVIDDTVTDPNQYDFYLISQSVNQGTVSPTHYNVIYDNTGLDADKMQRLTYKLTHLYYNWSGTIRVPAPCQFAHKLAFLTSQSLHSSTKPVLEDLLYFL